MAIVKIISLIVFFLLVFYTKIDAQKNEEESFFISDIQIDKDKSESLMLEIDNLNFFKNNEYDGDVIKGYTLPGFRLIPRLIYFPNDRVKLELGASMLRYWGADKYPNYTYQEIPPWKPDDYQYGFHILPIFRVQVRPMDQLNIILGSIYGGSNHRLITPLYDPSLQLMADPENGAQLLLDSRFLSLDTWINWESFIYENDNHNEAFTVGLSSQIKLTNPNSTFSLNIPLQGVFVHRGGEIDSVDGGVYSLVNLATGLSSKYKWGNNKHISLDLMGLSFREFGQSESATEDLEKTDIDQEGWALYAKLGIKYDALQLNFGFWRSDKFMSLFGNPIFGNYSRALKGRSFDKHDTYTSSLSYEHPFGNNIHMGADIDLYYSPKLMAYDDRSIFLVKESKSFNYSFGIYIRVNPSIMLKKF